ncbi:MAG: hypothetical protein KAR13_21450 [Desulfobulbaceae bacterium]|nr:hypothetical protein [Desulfobulbaceae bacterium]
MKPQIEELLIYIADTLTSMTDDCCSPDASVPVIDTLYDIAKTFYRDRPEDPPPGVPLDVQEISELTREAIRNEVIASLAPQVTQRLEQKIDVRRLSRETSLRLQNGGYIDPVFAISVMDIILEVAIECVGELLPGTLSGDKNV